uniref:Tc1-like transposase DDE domain-containing protein n=1 Tax=Pygocentrus nattereri TaxID=42514 RepID=A0AAR2M3I2_PYGNA
MQSKTGEKRRSNSHPEKDGVQHVWRLPGEEYQDNCLLPTVKRGGGSIMVCGCMSAAGTGELRFIEGNMNSTMYCDILKQSMIPSFWKLHRKAVFQQDNNPKYTSKMMTDFLKLKVMDWPSRSPDLNPNEHLWGILKWKEEERKVSNIHQLRDVIVEEWKRIPVATSAALVNSMPKRVQAVLDNNDDGHTNIDTLSTIWTCSL